jgi:hypothetical protein
LQVIYKEDDSGNLMHEYLISLNDTFTIELDVTGIKDMPTLLLSGEKPRGRQF